MVGEFVTFLVALKSSSLSTLVGDSFCVVPMLVHISGVC